MCRCSAQSSSHTLALSLWMILCVHVCAEKIPTLSGPDRITSACSSMTAWKEFPSVDRSGTLISQWDLNQSVDIWPVLAFQGFSHDNSCVCVCVFVSCAVFWSVHAVAGCLPVLYYKGVFIVSISEAVSSDPVSPGQCTHTETERKE